ncbi:MAG: hypothetical protein HQL36_09805 [Alphaproteobacteria bacterium]|nr:hypothetical protein [Alphaproteobacteria bacterium]
MSDDRKRGGLDMTGDTAEFTAFKPRPSVAPDSLEPARQSADASGFTARHAKPQIDGRKLRASRRTAQLNIAVHPDTKDRFWFLAHATGANSGEEFLQRLLDGFVGKGGE